MGKEGQQVHVRRSRGQASGAEQTRRMIGSEVRNYRYHGGDTGNQITP